MNKTLIALCAALSCLVGIGCNGSVTLGENSGSLQNDGLTTASPSTTSTETASTTTESTTETVTVTEPPVETIELVVTQHPIDGDLTAATEHLLEFDLFAPNHSVRVDSLPYTIYSTDGSGMVKGWTETSSRPTWSWTWWTDSSTPGPGDRCAERREVREHCAHGFVRDRKRGDAPDDVQVGSGVEQAGRHGIRRSRIPDRLPRRRDHWCDRGERETALVGERLPCRRLGAVLPHPQRVRVLHSLARFLVPLRHALARRSFFVVVYCWQRQELLFFVYMISRHDAEERKVHNELEPNPKLARLLGIVVDCCLYAAIILVPLFFLPFTLDILELNKQTLFLILTGVASLAWIGQAVCLRQFSLSRSWLHLVVAVFFVGYLVTTAFSLDRYLSFVGNIGQMQWSFITIAAFVLFYTIVVNTVKGTTKLYDMILAFLASSVLVGIFGLLQVLGIYPFGWMGRSRRRILSTPLER